VSLTLAAAGRRVATAATAGARRRAMLAWRVVVVAGIAALALRTVARNEDWTSGQRLWSSSAEAAPNSIKVIRALAAIAMDSDPSGARADQAVAIAMRGVGITEQAPLPLAHMPAALFADIGHYYSTKAGLLSANGDPAGSRQAFGQAVDMLKRAEAIDRAINQQGKERLARRGLRPEDIHDTGTATIYRNLGAAYLGLGEPLQAMEVLGYLVHIQPDSFDAYYVLGMSQGASAQMEQRGGNAEQARALFEKAAVSLVASVLLNPTHDASWDALAHIYGVLAPAPAAVVLSGGRRTLNLDHPAVQRHLRLAGAQLVRQLVEGGLDEEAANWRQRLVADFGVPPETFAPSGGIGPDPR
jgi:tetratricopeptide (TPR) repeat protein